MDKGERKRERIQQFRIKPTGADGWYNWREKRRSYEMGDGDGDDDDDSMLMDGW